MAEVLFSPNGGCEKRILRIIERTRRHLRLAAYSISSSNIVKALVQRSYAGVDMMILVDKQALDVEYGRALSLVKEHVPVCLDLDHALFHNKFIVSDKLTVQTGSYNYGVQAETANAENVLILKDAGIAAKYLANFEKHVRHAHVLTQANIRQFQTKGTITL